MAIAGAQRKQVLKVLMISLLLDLISFTFILPLFPSLLTFYRIQDSTNNKTSLLTKILHYLNAYKNAFALPIDSRYDIVLLGGALGSLFSLLQAIAAPIIGHLSDRHGRRRALLISMAGNIASVALWVSARDFRTFLASRVVGGLSEANVQLADAIVGDVTNDAGRSGCMALIGACFSVAFTVGPVLGAALGSVDVVKDNPFFVAAGVSLGFVLVETVFIWAFLPETHPRFTLLEKEEEEEGGDEKKARSSSGAKKGEVKKQQRKEPTHIQTNNPAILNALHFLFLLPFAGLEFSLPFFTATLYADTTTTSSSPAALNGRLLSLMGLIASLLQGTIVRRLPPLTTIRIGVIACALSFFLLARVETVSGLYAAGGLLAVTSATVVTGLKSLGSFEARDKDRGAVMGRLRGWGQAGRATGPVLFCSLFWWAGREVAYSVGGVAMLVIAGAVFLLLKAPVVRSKVD
ncbi:Major facilitator superfamily domain-containing protein 10 [Penicillium waksmanii]|uniref:Major facilitator superfamily domain-containing protein 10 n=1 Tax=Penicillium waksmanii TaxID=69791 RepID=UPI0025482168|nr:Major facilitator superfamily domain-containing protein 10 [Penicillium waksmanii]KAJ5984359.1 Major facilitator superfamily domain-containing protein 10 [Penicillium waksmanii]